MHDSLSFGAWLKRRRKALDLTQQALAERVGCSVVSIRKFEQETQRPSRALATRLAAQLQITPDDQQDFITFARFGTNTSPATLLQASTAHLPLWRTAACGDDLALMQWSAPQTTLVGRAQERAAVSAALIRSDIQLLTLTGPGGVGKTRLASAAVADLAASHTFAHGVCCINLAPIHDPMQVVPAIARALGVAERSTTPLLTRLYAFLHDKQMLLLLDNWEQVLDAAPLLAQLRAAAPACTFLVTSRARLALSGEVEVPVLPLAVPHPSPDDALTAITQSPAVQLFIARAQAVQPGLAVTTIDAHAIAAICRRLDGLPLAIELAAAHSNLLSPSQLLQRLEQRLPLLTGGARDLPQRQRTMRNTIAWGYDLLEPHVQVLFRRLAVFADGWTLEAAEMVCTHNGDRTVDVVLGLATLLDHNMVCQDPGPVPTARFRLLGTIREFAAEQLEASGEADTVRAAHVAYFVSVVEQAEHAESGDQLAWFARLEQDYANLHTALEYGPVEMTARLSAALADFWALRDQHQEGERWLDWVLGRNAALPPIVQARVQAALARVVYRRGDRMRERSSTDLSRVQHLLEESLAVYHMTDDQRAIADILIRLGEVLSAQGQTERAQAYLEASLAIAEQEKVPRLRVWALHGLALVACQQEAFMRASTLAVEALTLFRALGEAHGCAWALLVLAHTAAATGNLALAEQRHTERLVYERALGHREGIALTLMALADLALQQAKTAEAAERIAESVRLWRELGARDRVIEAVERAAEVALALGQHERMVQLQQTVVALHAATERHHADMQLVQASEQTLLEQAVDEAITLIG